MKRLLSIIFMLFILAGCSGSEDNMDRALTFRQDLLQREGCSFDCELTADYGELLYQFTLGCNADNKGNITFTVLSPESISGITGSISTTGGNIRFDDTLLGFPILSEELPTPLSAPWLFMTGLRSGYIRTSDYDNGQMSLTIADTYEDDSILMNIQFNEKDYPVSCEFIWKGRRILSMTITSFTYL